MCRRLRPKEQPGAAKCQHVNGAVVVLSKSISRDKQNKSGRTLSSSLCNQSPHLTRFASSITSIRSRSL